MGLARRILSLVLFTTAAALAQEPSAFRLTAAERAVQMRVTVLSPGGTTLYDSDWRGGNIVDFSGVNLPYGAYQLRISSRDVDGKLTEKVTTLQISAERITIDPALPDDLKLTTTAHDGTTGQLITTSGDLSFRFGDYLKGKDSEAMRLSPEGNLDVKGWIRPARGILFPDGSMLTSAFVDESGRGRAIKSPAGGKLVPKVTATGTGTMNQIAKWIDNAGTLGDSILTESGGNIGLGTTTPNGKLHIFGAATADVFAGMGVDMVAGPAFNFGYGGASFGRSAGFFNVRPDGSAVAPNPSLRFMTGNVERMIVTNAGNIGIGTSTPGGKLQVFAAPTADVFAGFGTDMSVGPSMNFGYGGATFGRGAGFFNARPDASAVSPNPSLRFMTNNVERMIITTDGFVGIGTSSPGATLDVNGGLNVSSTMNAATIGLSGNLALPMTTASTGVITLNGSPWAHAYGNSETFVGTNAGNLIMSGGHNSAFGYYALHNNSTGYFNAASGKTALMNNTTGYYNTAMGAEALFSNVAGANNTAVGGDALFKNDGATNTAVGYYALEANTSGNSNTAAGAFALESNTTGGANTAYGYNALLANTSGNSNIAIGSSAGFNLTTGDSNIDIGHQGFAAEANTIRIGSAGSQTRAFIAGIRNVTVGVDGINVVIDSNGQLGTTIGVPSSRRYKFDINSMGQSTEGLLQLRPVTFRYLAHGDQAPLQFGLIAEEVAEVYPELVTRDKDGQPDTVIYQFLAPMLLNEVQKQHETIESLQTTVARLTQRLETLEQQGAIQK